MSKAAELAALIGSQSSLSDRNLIINGSQAVAQRGASAVTVTGSAGYRTVDRFKTDIDGSGGGNFSHAQSTDVPSKQGFQYSSKFTTVTQASQPTSEGNRHQLYTLLEEQDVFHLEWGTSNAKTCTLSFWVKGSVTGTYGFIFGHYGSGGTYYYYTNYTINSANTWEKKTITVTGPTVGGNNAGGNSFGLRVEWILGVGSDAETGTLNQWTTSSTMRTAANTVYLPETSGATLYLTGVQLELGETATPFEHRSFGDELARCQRYYEKSYNRADAPATLTTANVIGRQIDDGGLQRDGIDFQIIKRASPTVTIYNPTTGSTASIRTNANVDYSPTVFAVGENRATVAYTPASGQYLFFHFTADAEL